MQNLKQITYIRTVQALLFNQLIFYVIDNFKKETLRSDIYLETIDGALIKVNVFNYSYTWSAEKRNQQDSILVHK